MDPANRGLCQRHRAANPEPFPEETNNAEGTDGVFLFSHTYGCSQLGDDHINTRTMLQNMVRHPNAGAVLVIGLGCENNKLPHSVKRWAISILTRSFHDLPTAG